MADVSTARQPTLLTLPTEIRQNIYYQLFAVADHRNLQLCGCNKLGFYPTMPFAILATCCQIYQEVTANFKCFVGALTLVDGTCDDADVIKLQARNAILSKYGDFVTEVNLKDNHCEGIDMQETFGCCPRIEQVTVDVSGYELEVEGHEDKVEGWWLESDEVREWLWPLWKQKINDYWGGCEYAALRRLLNREKEEGRKCSVNYITTFELLDCENTLHIVFNGDTGETLRRWLDEPCNEDGDDDEDENEDGDDEQGEDDQGGNIVNTGQVNEQDGTDDEDNDEVESD